MLPNLNPKQMKKMMSQLGLSMDEIDAEEVLIKLRSGSEIRISEPEVVKMKVQGKESFQVTGNVSEGSSSVVELQDADIDMVMSQAGVSRNVAVAALEKEGGDIAKAILGLESQDSEYTGE